jgi:NADH dehydrogenase [ubiquinone] 1 alpha subcomplex assembly factor 7
MTTPLAALIKNHIRQYGPMDVGEFMALALGHPQHGYYMHQQPFGADGDFTTAPEISQMFGEMIGAWAADLWAQMGRPGNLALVECGPGRGTLMADIMRATKSAEGFHAAAQIHLIETSLNLRHQQSQLLAAYKPVWHESLTTLPDDCPVLVIGNEFLDALPMRQLQKVQHGWDERVIYLSEDEESFAFGTRPAEADLVSMVPVHLKFQIGDVFEVGPARRSFARDLADRIKNQGGAALFIDYGPSLSGVGDTLQAVKSHHYAGVFDDIGLCDLTSHVDFELLAKALAPDMQVYGPTMQGAFLKNLGIDQRAAGLMKNASEQQAQDIQTALKRLCDPDQMGILFKAIGFCHDKNLKPAGF